VVTTFLSRHLCLPRKSSATIPTRTSRGASSGRTSTPSRRSTRWGARCALTLSGSFTSKPRSSKRSPNVSRRNTAHIAAPTHLNRFPPPQQLRPSLLQPPPPLSNRWLLARLRSPRLNPTHLSRPLPQPHLARTSRPPRPLMRNVSPLHPATIKL
jgi:hypothetical protein